MSINWVMLHERDTFVRLPNEQLIYTSPPRTSFALQPLPSYTGRDSLSLQSSTGRVYLTSQRVVYIPAQTSKDLESFSAPLLNIHDSHVSSPFFGPNAWIALVQPVAGGGIPPSLAAVQLKVTFKEGGAFEFHNQFERIKERLQHAVEISRETGRGPRNVDMTNVHLDELPAYPGPQSGASASTHNSSQRDPPRDAQGVPETGAEPMGPPPGYEEVQQQSVANELEARLRQAN
ncbi:hypothetical protein P175DRAFT_0535184 [Aspergillus ochraceoroseus IBT 24754]|uniref:GRAM domain-containing protein n=1 Tax=Aspergillus ochraceoroseus IBT 24754 TaxID=1392256 RepID=A0A2T5LPQ6_9EURO|nr:uncharacterized protein P175DRAFT_0535184 [Aspergillus ochraceoroseus IBT 24754]PTU18270.1 hypothetical protein P175DRAFT_0535184 [Aspergillus ochraceoroseus IBT 24754]